MDRPGGGQEEPGQDDARNQAAADQPGEPDRPEQLVPQAERRAYGEIDPSKISDEALLSYFGYDDWDDWRRTQEEPDGERVVDELLEAADGTERRLSANLSSEPGKLEALSLEDLTPPQFRDRTDVPGEPKYRGDSPVQHTETGAEAVSLVDEPRELSPDLVRWLTGHSSQPWSSMNSAGQESGSCPQVHTVVCRSQSAQIASTITVGSPMLLVVVVDSRLATCSRWGCRFQRHPHP